MRNVFSSFFQYLIRDRIAFWIVFFWWAGWFFLSVKSESTSFPTITGQYVLICFLVSLLLGGFSFNFVIRAPSKEYAMLLWTILVPLVLCYGWILYVYIKLINTGSFDLSQIRASFFLYGFLGIFWFPYKFMWSAFLIISGSALQFLYIYFIPGILERKFSFVILTLFLILMETVVKGGRGPIYSICIVCFLYFLLSIREVEHRKFYYRHKGKIAALLVSILISVSAINYLRGNTANIVDQAVSYHTVGFGLFSNIVTSTEGWESAPVGYGRYMIGGVDSVFTSLVRQVDSQFDSFARLSSEIQAKQVPNALNKGSNSFYTLLAPIFLDFREFGVIIFGFFLGVILVSLEKSYILNRKSSSLVLLILVYYNCMFGIFGSPLETVGFWFSFIMIAFRFKKNTNEFRMFR